MEDPKNYFELTFSGRVAQGFDPETVRTNATKLFHLSPQKSERLLSGTTIILKKRLSATVADTYRQKLATAGLLCDVRPTATGPSPMLPTEVVTESPPSVPDDGTFPLIDESLTDATLIVDSVTTPVADQMTESAEAFEIISLDADVVDTDGFDVNEVVDFPPEADSRSEIDTPADNEYLLDSELWLDNEISPENKEPTDAELPAMELPEIEPQPVEPEPVEPQPESADERDGFLAPVGAQVNQEAQKTPPPAPDISHLSLSPQTGYLFEPTTEPTPEPPDTSHLSLADMD